MVLIDDRMCNMSSIARNYAVYLIQHELCHQWWYNIIGTNGYAETFLEFALSDPRLGARLRDLAERLLHEDRPR